MTFITVEGIEGVGKSTAVKFIHDYLIKAKQSVVLTREPGGTLIAEKIRQVLLTPTPEEKMEPDTELLLVFAARAQHIRNVILPELKAKKWVISDRFIDATFAYQGGGRQMDISRIETLERWIVNGLHPDMTLLLDAPAHVGLERAKHRGPRDRIEQEKIAFFERVREGYLKRAARDKKRFCIIDAAQSLEKVHLELKNILDKLLLRENK